MVNPSRETVMAALWARVSSAANFNTKSRILRHWSDLAPEDYNAIFMAKAAERIERRRGVPPKTTLGATLYVYVRTNTENDDGAQSPSEILDPILDAIDLALKPDATDPVKGNVCTLGGIVSHAWISGEIITSEGTLGNIEVAIVPVEVLVPVLVNQ